MRYPKNIREEELKIKVGQDWFDQKIYDCSKKPGNIDFCVTFRNENASQFSFNL